MSNHDNNRPLTAKERRKLEKRRSEAARQARNYHKQNRKSDRRAVDSVRPEKKRRKKPAEEAARPAPENRSKVVSAAMRRQKSKLPENGLTREEKFIRESDRKIRGMKPRDYEDGYYVDEFSARQKQKRRAREIHTQETEHIRRPKKPVSPKRLRMQRVLLCCGIILAVLIVGIILSLTVLFKTEKIKVEGDSYYYEEQITALSNVSLQQNIFIAVMNSTPQNITDNLPYVEDVEIGFDIPDTVTIKVTDATVGYVIKVSDGYLMVSTKGRILEKKSDNSSELPELACSELETTEVGSYLSFSNKNIPDILESIIESLSQNNITEVTSFDVTDTANIKLVYDDRITVNLGLPEDIDYKIRTAEAIITEKLDPNNAGTVTGTLDVSSCSTTKISHYKPDETTAPAATEASSTASTEDGSDDYQSSDYSFYGESTDSGSSEVSEDYADSGDGYSYYADDSGG